MNDLLILAALLEGPKHGYALKKHAGLISGQTDMHNNLVYPLLRRTERFAPLQKEMDLGVYGTEVVRFIQQQIKRELAWIEQLRRLNRATKRKSTKTAR